MAQPAPWVPDEEVSECPLCTQKWLVLQVEGTAGQRWLGSPQKRRFELGTSSANRGFDGTISITNWHWIGKIVDLDFHGFSGWACLMTKVHGLNPIKTQCFVGWISINNRLSQSSHPIPWYPHKMSMIYHSTICWRLKSHWNTTCIHLTWELKPAFVHGLSRLNPLKSRDQHGFHQVQQHQTQTSLQSLWPRDLWQLQWE